MNKLTLMAVFAHPDDEAFGTGGKLAKYAAQGCDVYLVTATRGEAGQIAEPDLATAVIDVSEHAEAKLRGTQCHTIQVGRSNRFADTSDGTLQDPWFRHEHFLLARSTVGWPEKAEADLFTRIVSGRASSDACQVKR